MSHTTWPRITVSPMCGVILGLETNNLQNQITKRQCQEYKKDAITGKFLNEEVNKNMTKVLFGVPFLNPFLHSIWSTQPRI